MADDTPDGRRGIVVSDGPSPAQTADPGHEQPNNKLVVAGGTVAMVVIGLALVSSVIELWPIVDHGTAANAQGTQMVAITARSTAHLLFGLVPVSLTTSTALLVLVLIAGASGSLIHAATSFADFVGNRRLYSRWAVWYVLRLIIGMILALVLYFAVRGGFFSASSQSADVNPYGIAALAALAGLFSKQATDKLREVFETLFQVNQGGGDAQRKDDLTPGKPVISGLEPAQAVRGSTKFKLTVHGEHFVRASVVRANGVDQKTTFISPETLDAELLDALLAAESTLQVTVFTPPPGGGQSSPPAVLGVTSPDPPPANPPGQDQ